LAAGLAGAAGLGTGAEAALGAGAAGLGAGAEAALGAGAEAALGAGAAPFFDPGAFDVHPEFRMAAKTKNDIAILTTDISNKTIIMKIIEWFR
jgi:hypothetical protein